MANKKHLTTRDLKLINFLEETNLFITAEQAAKWFYKSPSNNHKSALTVAQRRLATCHELNKLKRFRDHIDQSFIYYTGDKPRKIEHKIMMMNFIISMYQRYEILEIHSEFKDIEKAYNLRPDLYIVFKFGNNVFATFVEVENTKNFTSGEKYAHLYTDKRQGKLKETLPYITTLICVSKNDPINDFINPTWIKDDLSDFVKLEYKLIKLMEFKK